MQKTKTIEIDHARCLHCGTCVAVCVENAMFLNDIVLSIADELCTRCGVCARVCPVGALKIHQREAA